MVRKELVHRGGRAITIPLRLAVAATAGVLWIGRPLPAEAQRMGSERPPRRWTQRRYLSCSEADDACRTDDFEEVECDVPVSFSLTTHTPLVGQFSLETGLTCTFLSNALRHSRFGKMEEETKLYYLGVPVNITGDCFTSGRWTLYLSAGGMVEKGLRRVRHLTTCCGHRTTTSVRKTSIPGLEWSLAATAGLSYRLAGKWHLYAEQKLTYYFDTHQPLSAHTDTPFPHVFGIGVRYRF